jgi:hypothetical protein
MNYVVSITDSEWHPVTAWHAERAPYTLTMLYWKCAKGILAENKYGPDPRTS